MLSIWERNSFIQYDHIILGSGIVGLMTAYHLKKKFPTHSILVLERGILPSGASTKNAGFACMGSPTELLDDLEHTSKDEVLELFLLRQSGLSRLRSILGDHAIGYQANGSHELLFEEDMYVLDKLNDLNQFLYPALETNAFTISSDKISSYQFNPQKVKAMIENTCEGEIDTGRMMRSLIQLVTTLGIEIKTGCQVESFHEVNHEVNIVCRSPYQSNGLVFKAANLFICTNAFANQLLKNYDITPGRGQVLITKPIENLAFKGIFHFNQGYYYFREYQGCVLFGGGRNKDFENEASTNFELNEMIQEDLKQKLREIIIPNKSFEIDLQWTGIMAFGTTKQPIIQRHSNRILIGVRMGGMGIAIGSEVGYRLANLL
jgi:gamma-glutamylputrescine oxidase